MKLIKPFSAAFSAFRTNIPNMSSECAFMNLWLTRRLKDIEDSSSFSLKEMHEFEKSQVKDRPEKFTYDDALTHVVANQEIALDKSKKKFLKSYIPGTSCFVTFGSLELLTMMFTLGEIPWCEVWKYTGIPFFILAYGTQYLVRSDSVGNHTKKLRIAKALKELSIQNSKEKQ